VGEDRGRWEQREGVDYIGRKDIAKAAKGARLRLKVCEGAVTCLPIGLDEAVDVEPVNMVEEGTIFQ